MSASGNAAVMGMSVRQVPRLLRRFRAEGAAAIRHKAPVRKVLACTAWRRFADYDKASAAAEADSPCPSILKSPGRAAERAHRVPVLESEG